MGVRLSDGPLARFPHGQYRVNDQIFKGVFSIVAIQN